MHTIFAVSSGMPPAAIAVLRISGEAAFSAAKGLAGSLPSPRQAGVRLLRDPANGDPLDRALMLCFPGPASATGEDIVELHLHGGRAVVRSVERALDAMADLRRAEPGEFTRRALANGRIDLTEAEGLGDLLSAETESQRRQALGVAEGGLRRTIALWTERLLGIAAGVEALLDHGDEEDVASTASVRRLGETAGALADEIDAVLALPPAERLRDGIRVVLAGPPNAGKSTLINALAGREAAIVSPVAGTTRDRIEVPLVRDGIAYLFTDTAGLADATDDAIEEVGIARAREAMARADILLWLGDESPPPHPRILSLHPRSDKAARATVPMSRLGVSAATGEGLPELWTALGEAARDLLPPEDALSFNQRQHGLASQAAAALRRAADETDEVLMAEDLRAARQAFDAITGRADVESMLDALFSRFCIGK
ncbi:tRNA uridine-5-carboxymethylaminomethyl(34) synthesis GTPase MnmE [Sphingosinithalassobacter portus]|uniref:tRNA uridine-5-carboxymethylaminomethyl(34) synthesis GTPase MnmE n=1 Tax=Stakelama portus TaxID=2676234 RepID=UPI00187479ED|nr:tRNA uridine-5-carboxymethylaminomethyl(34) synthesis GTPase MnmE [Sphingosinithalassobacter portus]